MPRLVDLLLDKEGQASFELSFGRDGKVAAVVGKVEASLVLECQCCLGAIPWAVRSEVRLGVVKTIAEADLLPESYEPLLLEGDTIPLADIVQEELLLAVPSIPQHAQCGPAVPAPQEMAMEPAKRPNPFAVLAKLKQ
ncbi:MAG: YceD family protein [Candidatus Methylumidiphilus sp.]